MLPSRRTFSTYALLIILLLSTILPAKTARAQETPPTYTYQECAQAEEARLRDELNKITQSAFKADLSVAAIVDDKWVALNMDAAVNAAVDAAIARVGREESYLSRVWSSWSPEKAEELATKVADYAFDSPGFHAAVDRLWTEIATELVAKIDDMAAKSASAALLCVQEFIGNTFSQTMVSVLDKQIQDTLDELISDADVDPDSIVISQTRANTLIGVGTIIGTQIAKQLAQKMGQSIVGKVVGRILGKAAASWIPIAGWIIGAGLIVWDLVAAREGALPQIRKSLQQPKVKAEIRARIANVVDTDLQAELPELARSVADNIFSLWIDFLDAHRRVLELARENRRFQTLLNYLPVKEVEKLSELVSVADATLEPEQLGRIINTGQFERIFALPQPAFEILREYGDPDMVIAWADLAGEAIVEVVETELYVIASPSAFRGREALERVLALQDPAAIQQWMQLNQGEQDALLELETEQSRSVLIALSAEDLAWLAAYLPELPPQATNLLADTILREPALMPILKESEEIQAKFPRVLTLAQTYPRFQTILNNTTADQVNKLSELVAVADETLKPEQLPDMINTGQFERIFALPQPAFEILTVSGDPQVVIAWADLAGKAIVEVVETELYVVTSPSAFRGRETLNRGFALPALFKHPMMADIINGREALSRVLALQDPTAIEKLMSLNRSGQDVLLELETERARSILIALSPEDLAWLAAYLPELPPQATNLLADTILRAPGLMSMLKESEEIQAKFPRVLTLAQTYPRFQTILNNTTADQVDKLSELVALADETLEPERLPDMINTGQFERIFALPQSAFEILKERGDPQLVIDWADLAGEAIVEVVETELYRVASSSDFREREALNRVLALQDPAAIEKLMLLNQPEQDVLLELATEQARSVLIALSPEDLAWLAAYLPELPPQATNLLVDTILRAPGLMSILKESEEIQAKFPRVLTLAQTNPRFQTILNNTTADQVDKLSELVALADETLEPEQLGHIINTGQFERIFALPQPAFEILREYGDPDMVIAWADLAGEAIVEVVETELYVITSSSEFRDREALNRVLALQDSAAIQKLMLLNQSEQDVLLELATEQARSVLIDLSPEDLAWLVTYLPELPPDATNLLVDTILREPGLMSILKESENLRTKFPRVLALAQTYPRFQTILNNTTADQVDKLSELVALADETLGPERLPDMINTGQFERIFALPQPAFEILKGRGDPQVVIAWADLAGKAIVEVVETELYRVASSSDFRDREALNRVLALQDSAAIQKLMLLNQSEQDVLLELATEQARSVLIALSPEDLAWLAAYLPELPPQATNLLADTILREPALMSKLKESEDIRSKFPRVLTLAQTYPRFQTILNNTTADQVDKLSELVALADETLGPERLGHIINTGQFERIFALPQPAFEILTVSDPEVVIAWADLADAAIVQVVETGLYRVASPSDFREREALNRVLALQDPEAIQKLIQLHQLEQVLLLKLPTEQSRSVLIALSPEDLSGLAIYLAELPPQATNLLVDTILREPGLMSKLKESEDIRSKFPRVLTLAQTYPRFQTILNNTTADQVEKLSELVALADETLGPERLPDMINTGQFERIFALPQQAFEILKGRGDPQVVIAWADLAGEAIVEVVETELYVITSPSDFRDREALNRVLALQDSAAIQKLMLLNQSEQDVLLELPTEQARSVLIALSPEDLAWLVTYLPELPPQATNLLADTILREPALMSKLKESEDIQAKFPRVLTLAQTYPRFQTILNNTTADQVDKLSELVALADETLGPERLPDMINTGQFERIFALPQPAFEILREYGDPDMVIAWADLAGEAIVEVVETELYRVASPSDFREREALSRVLAPQDSAAIQKLMQLNQSEQDVLLELPTEQARSVLIDLSPEDLSGLAAYLPELPPQATNLLVDTILRAPGLMSKLKESENLRAKFPRVLTLAQTNPRFQTILNNTTADQVDKLSELVSLADETLKPEQLPDMINTGQFERIFALPQQAFDILTVSEDPQLVIAWADLADAAIVQVVETGLYRVASPSDFREREALNRVLALQAPEAIEKLILLNQSERDVLLGLPTTQPQKVIAALSPEDLAWLVTYLTELPSDDTNLLVATILREPRLMSQLKFENIRRAVLESQNLQATLDFLVEEKAQVLADIGSVLSGDVPWALFWHKYGTASNMLVSSGLLLALLILYLLGRNIFRRRQPEM